MTAIATPKPTTPARAATLPAAEIVLADAWAATLRITALEPNGASSYLLSARDVAALAARGLIRGNATTLTVHLTDRGQQWIEAHPTDNILTPDLEAALRDIVAAGDEGVGGVPGVGGRESRPVPAKGLCRTLQAAGYITGRYQPGHYGVCDFRATARGYAHLDPTDRRIRRTVSIERSTDDGATWQTVDFEFEIRHEGPSARVVAARSAFYHASSMVNGGAIDPSEVCETTAAFFGLSNRRDMWRIRAWIGEPAGRAPAFELVIEPLCTAERFSSEHAFEFEPGGNPIDSAGYTEYELCMKPASDRIHSPAGDLDDAEPERVRSDSTETRRPVGRYDATCQSCARVVDTDSDGNAQPHQRNDSLRPEPCAGSGQPLFAHSREGLVRGELTNALGPMQVGSADTVANTLTIGGTRYPIHWNETPSLDRLAAAVTAAGYELAYGFSVSDNLVDGGAGIMLRPAPHQTPAGDPPAENTATPAGGAMTQSDTVPGHLGVRFARVVEAARNLTPEAREELQERYERFADATGDALEEAGTRLHDLAVAAGLVTNFDTNPARAWIYIDELCGISGGAADAAIAALAIDNKLAPTDARDVALLTTPWDSMDLPFDAPDPGPTTVRLDTRGVVRVIAGFRDHVEEITKNDSDGAFANEAAGETALADLLQQILDGGQVDPATVNNLVRSLADMMFEPVDPEPVAGGRAAAGEPAAEVAEDVAADAGGAVPVRATGGDGG